MNTLDDITEQLEAAQRAYDRACDNYEAYKRAYFEDPCPSHQRQLQEARTRMAATYKALNAVLEAVSDDFEAWEEDWETDEDF